MRFKARNDGWQRRKRNARGGGYEYHITSLPPETRAHLAAARCSELQAGERVQQPAPVARPSTAGLAALTGRRKARVESRLEILELAERYQRHSQLGKSHAVHDFCHRYTRGDIDVSEQCRALIPHLHPATLYRWRRALKTEGAARLASNYGTRRGSGLIDQQPELREYIEAFIAQHPHATAVHIHHAAAARFANTHVRLPTRRRLSEWLRRWQREHAELHLAIADPDAWRSRYQSAQGTAEEHVSRLNELWELDSTPADVMLADGRHSLIGSIDVATRRASLLVVRTSTAAGIAALMRRCIIDWGVPERAKTDEGADYTSHHITRVLHSLDIEHDRCPPFQPQLKPYIERFFRTFSHDLVELLGGYIGHSVADRQAIENRQSFAQRLMERDQVIDCSMTANEFQAFCDQWIESLYMQREHRTLGMPPAQAVARSADKVKRIEDERQLDVLLAESVERTAGKKGLSIEGIRYIAPELAQPGVAGERVLVRLDPADVGRVYVFHDEQFLCVAEAPEYTGIDRTEVAATARQAQKKAVQERRRELKAAARRLNTRDAAEEILRHAQEQANVTVLPRPEERHTTEQIEAAGEAVQARQPETTDPERRAEMDRLREQLVADIDEQRNAAAEASEIAEADNPLRRYERWLRLDRRVQSGEQLALADARFHERYPSSTEYRAMRDFHDDFYSAGTGAGNPEE